MQESYWNWAKRRIAAYLLADEVAKIDLQREAFKQASANLDRNIAEFEAYKAKLTITDMVREQLRGFNPTLLDIDDNRGLEHLIKSEELEGFLGNCKSLSEDSALPQILDYLTRNQIQESVCRGATFNAMEFGKATVNGLSLLREEVIRLAAVHDARHAPSEDYDKHGVV